MRLVHTHYPSMERPANPADDFGAEPLEKEFRRNLPSGSRVTANWRFDFADRRHFSIRVLLESPDGRKVWLWGAGFYKDPRELTNQRGNAARRPYVPLRTPGITGW